MRGLERVVRSGKMIKSPRWGDPSNVGDLKLWHSSIVSMENWKHINFNGNFSFCWDFFPKKLVAAKLFFKEYIS